MVKRKQPQKQSKKKKKQNGIGRKVSVPVSQSRVVRSERLRNLHIKHREFLMDLTPVAGKVRKSVSFNPGLANTFPWLWAIATRFEMYKFHSLAIHYVPYCATSTSGQIILAWDADAKDDNGQLTKQELMAFNNNVVSPVYAEATLHVSKKAMLNLFRYSRSGTIGGNHDIKTYDTGKLEIWLETNLAALNGALFVSYNVELLTPQLSSEIPFGTDFMMASAYNLPFNTRASSGLEKGLDLKVGIPDGLTATQIAIDKPGKYLLNLTSEDSTGLTSLQNIIGVANAAVTMIGAATDSTDFNLLAEVEVSEDADPDNPGILDWQGVNAGATLNTTDVILTQVDSTFTSV